MSYLVLARKYRPRRFAEMVGQEHVVQALGNALAHQRLHHAYLFTGTRGVGKTTVSRILAKSLNCTGADGQGGITPEPCGVCPACRDIDAGRHVDYIELDAASNRGVDEISQLLDQAVYKPVVGRFKVYMIDEVHMLTTTAFNAMLKTLEEPPEYLKFVLATTDPQKVPVTVLSRCLQFNLRPMAPSTIAEHLQGVLGAESVPAEPTALRLIARAARGSMRDALSLTDQAIAFGAGRLDEGTVRQMLGSVDRSHVARLIEALAASDGVALHAVVEQLRGLGLSAAGTLEELALLAQAIALHQAVPTALDPTDPETSVVQRLSPLLPPDEIQLMYSLALQGRQELGLAPDEYGGLLMVLLRLLAFRPAGAPVVVRPAPAPAPAAMVVPAPVAVPLPPVAPPSPLPPAASIPPWEDLPQPGIAPQLVQEEPSRPFEVGSPGAAETEPETEPESAQTRWLALAGTLIDQGRVTALTRELVMQAQCLQLDERATPARCELQVERATLAQDGYRDRLRAALCELQGLADLQLTLSVGPVQDNLARREAQAREQAKLAAEAVIRDDPQVRALLERFPGSRIVPGSIRPL
jgi:DNA polymerase III subunit gamma/tau